MKRPGHRHKVQNMILKINALSLDNLGQGLNKAAFFCTFVPHFRSLKLTNALCQSFVFFMFPVK
jgi:hypothetical protein